MIGHDKSSDILNWINDKSADLSKEEPEHIINDELERSEDIMDADLNEYCLDALNELNADESPALEKIKAGDTNGKRITHKFRKAVAVAAAAVFLFAGAVSVFAFVFDANIFEGLVEFYNDHIRIRFDKIDDNASD